LDAFWLVGDRGLYNGVVEGNKSQANMIGDFEGQNEAIVEQNIHVQNCACFTQSGTTRKNVILADTIRVVYPP
jgi:hypothetical protein